MKDEPGHLSVGMKAPDFTSDTTHGNLHFADLKGKWVVLFSHPGDFTPVCTTEFIAFSKAANEFKNLNTQLLGLSIDSNPSHLAWVNAIYQNTGIQVPFPIIADRMGEVAKKYGMIAPEVSGTETVRNVFIIDPDQKIRAILIYPLTNGRYIPEILRLLRALQTTDAYKVATPANWEPGGRVVVSPPQTYDEMMERQNNPAKQNLTCDDWWLCYKNTLPEGKK